MGTQKLNDLLFGNDSKFDGRFVTLWWPGDNNRKEFWKFASEESVLHEIGRRRTSRNQLMEVHLKDWQIELNTSTKVRLVNKIHNPFKESLESEHNIWTIFMKWNSQTT